MPYKLLGILQLQNIFYFYSLLVTGQTNNELFRLPGLWALEVIFFFLNKCSHG